MVKETKFYDILGLQPNASDNEIKKGYRLMALKWHPDKNNHSQESTEKFQEITRAYEVLHDPKQRAIYDRFGEEGLNPSATIDPNHDDNMAGGAFSMKADDLFSQFFGENFFNPGFGDGVGSGTSRQRHVRKGPDIKHKLTVTLEDLYKGKSTKLGLSRTILCPKCDAKGGQNIKQCLQCKGRGRVVYQKQLGPIIQRFESSCDACRGTGEYMNSKDRCTNCHGVKTVEERKILKLDILPGTKHGQQIVFQDEGDQGIGIIPGDVVVTIEEKKHEFFSRRGADLLYKARIDLVTALTGGVFGIPHISGEFLKVEIIPGEIIKPNSFKVIPGSGMPKDGKNSGYGDLIIRFEVEFPEASKLTEESYDLLKRALPKSTPVEIPDDKVPVEKILADYNPYQHGKLNENKKTSKKRRKSSDDDGDALMDDEVYDEFGPSENVQCATQ